MHLLNFGFFCCLIFNEDNENIKLYLSLKDAQNCNNFCRKQLLFNFQIMTLIISLLTSCLFSSFQGDGESAPDTPPPELAPDSTPEDDITRQKRANQSKLKSKKLDHASDTSKKPANGTSSKRKSSSNDEEHVDLNLNLSMDGISTLLFVVSFATRVWKLDTPAGVV